MFAEALCRHRLESLAARLRSGEGLVVRLITVTDRRGKRVPAVRVINLSDVERNETIRCEHRAGAPLAVAFIYSAGEEDQAASITEAADRVRRTLGASPHRPRM